MNIGAKLKVLRKQKKLTQQELADKLNITRATISNWEIGRRKPNLHELTAICDFYGVDLSYFRLIKKDYMFDCLSRAKNIFNDKEIPKEKKDKLFNELMKLYVAIK